MTHAKQKFNNILLQERNKNKTRLTKKKPKTSIVIQKVIESLTFIYTPWGPNSRMLSWKLRPHVWPMSTHAAHKRLKMN